MSLFVNSIARAVSRIPFLRRIQVQLVHAFESGAAERSSTLARRQCTSSRGVKLSCLRAGAALGIALQASVSHASASQPLVIGVGNITNTWDYTSESFNLLRYLQGRHSEGVRFELVDHPADSAFAITGHIDGVYAASFRMSMKNTRVTYSHNIRLVFWRDGRRVASLAGPLGAESIQLPPKVIAGEVLERHDGDKSRERYLILEPLWTLVEQKLHELRALPPHLGTQ